MPLAPPELAELVRHAQEIADAAVTRATDYRKQFRCTTDGMCHIEHEDIFPYPKYAIKLKPVDWYDSDTPCVYAMNYPRGTYMGDPIPFRIGNQRIPDWVLGYISFEQRTCLPEEGTPDDFKQGVLQMLGDNVVAHVREIRDLFLRYNIEVNEASADFVTGEIRLACSTQRSVQSVNGVLTNHRVRKVMTGRVVVEVDTYVEPHNRTDDYLGASAPPKQIVLKTYVYQDKKLLLNEPACWTAGTKYGDGDLISVGTLRWRVGEDIPNPFGGRPQRDPVEMRLVGRAGEQAVAHAPAGR